MNDKNRIEELIRRVKKTAKSKYRASERLEQHHRLARTSVALLSSSLLCLLMVQVLGVEIGYSDRELNIAELILAFFVLVYSLLLGQEHFNTRSEDMNRNGTQLSSFTRKLAGMLERDVDEAEYQSLVNKYYEILDKGESHKTIDFMFIRIENRPAKAGDWPFYIANLIRAYFWYFILFSPYLLAILVAVTSLFLIVAGVLSSNNVIN
ncbi:SLATT domain-containing protein [Fibrobacterota bacterium]